MKKTIRKPLALLLAFFLLFSYGSLAAEVAIQEQQSSIEAKYGYDFLMQIADFIAENYKFGITSEELKNRIIEYMYKTGSTDFDGCMDAMFTLLDKHSQYLPPEKYESLITSISGATAGIGVGIFQAGGQFIITKVYESSPADKVGLQVNDVIVSVNGVLTEGMDVNGLSERIRGEMGSSVVLGIRRGEEIAPLMVTVVRGSFEQSPVSYRIMDGGVGYLYLSEFSETAPKFIKQALEEFDKQNITKIALDLRDNPGGSLPAVVEICNYFIPSGPVVYVEYKDAANNEVFNSYNTNPKYKLAVLVNDGTASASELFSGTAQDSGVAKLFGTKTYGKGTVQQVMQLKTGGGFRLTIAQYFTRNKQNVNENAITPDVVLENEITPVSDESFEPLDFEVFPKLGDTGKNVLAIEQRLHLLGLLFREPGETFDHETADAIKKYQAVSSGFQTGEVDLQFIFNLNNIEYNKLSQVNDKQLTAALEYLRGL